MMTPSKRHLRLLLKCVAGAAVTTALSSALALKVDMYAIGNWSGVSVRARHLDEAPTGGIRSAQTSGVAATRRFGCSDARAAWSARP